MAAAMENLHNKILGGLIGDLVGDAMGAVTEGLHYEFIAKRFGEITDLTEHRGLGRGAGTDNSALKHMLCEAIAQCEGNVSAAAWADIWRKRMNPRDFYRQSPTHFSRSRSVT